jgi:hypothetical protein
MHPYIFQMYATSVGFTSSQCYDFSSRLLFCHYWILRFKFFSVILAPAKSVHEERLSAFKWHNCLRYPYKHNIEYSFRNRFYCMEFALPTLPTRKASCPCSFFHPVSPDSSFILFISSYIGSNMAAEFTRIQTKFVGIPTHPNFVWGYHYTLGQV